MHLVGFTVEIYYDARSYKHKISYYQRLGVLCDRLWPAWPYLGNTHYVMQVRISFISQNN